MSEVAWDARPTPTAVVVEVVTVVTVGPGGVRGALVTVGPRGRLRGLAPVGPREVRVLAVGARRCLWVSDTLGSSGVS